MDVILPCAVNTKCVYKKDRLKNNSGDFTNVADNDIYLEGGKADN